VVCAPPVVEKDLDESAKHILRNLLLLGETTGCTRLTKHTRDQMSSAVMQQTCRQYAQ